MRVITAIIVLMSFLICSACSKEEQPRPENVPVAATPTKNEPVVPSPKQATGTAAGIEWKVPQGWQIQAPRPMRIATYTIPRSSGDSEDGECGVFFFGSGQGGDVRSNINRWVSQFETDQKPAESSRTVNGISVMIVGVQGTYLAPGGPMMQSQGKKVNFRLLGAIVEAPQGNVFFKSTGPAASITAAEKDFSALIDSIQNSPI